jgi:hypothetical protein
MDKLCLSVLDYYKSQIVSLWSIIKFAGISLLTILFFLCALCALDGE